MARRRVQKFSGWADGGINLPKLPTRDRMKRQGEHSWWTLENLNDVMTKPPQWAEQEEIDEWKQNMSLDT